MEKEEEEKGEEKVCFVNLHTQGRKVTQAHRSIHFCGVKSAGSEASRLGPSQVLFTRLLQHVLTAVKVIFRLECSRAITIWIVC